MKQHFKLLATMPEIDPFLATQSLFPWEGEYNLEGGDSHYITRVTDESGNLRTLTSTTATPSIVLAAETGSTDIVIKTGKSTVHDEHLCTLLSAMGLNASITGDEVRFGNIDAEVLHSRLGKLDSAWCCIRRIKEFESDINKVVESAMQIYRFANDWSKNRLDSIQEPEGKLNAVALVTNALEERARKFKDWSVNGLEALKLNYDPRGSILDLVFRGHYPNGLCAANFDWPVGKTIGQAMSELNRKTKFGKYEVRPTRIPEEVQGVLNGLVIEGCNVRIVDQLPKRLYDKVDNTLQAIGGRWHTGHQAHVFEEDPTSMIDTLIESGEVYTARDFEFFATQPPLVSLVIAKANIQPGMTILEPSAGRAALAMAAADIVGKANVTCFELMPENVTALKKLGFAQSGPVDFLEVKPEPIYDRVIANPPFSNFRDCAHIRKAYDFLKPGGVLVTIASTQWQTHDTRPAKEFRKYLDDLGANVEQIPAGAFRESGTNVATTLITLTKPLQSVPEIVEQALPNVVEAKDPLAFLL
jgi:predicted RNA methylase